MKTIKVTEKVHAQLEKLGVKGESFNEIIERLLAEHAKKEAEK